MEPEQWEYEFFSAGDDLKGGWFEQPSREVALDRLNALGREGWEVINAQFQTLEGAAYHLRAILKRRRQ